MDLKEILANKDSILAKKCEKPVKKSIDGCAVLTKELALKANEGVVLSERGIEVNIVANTPYFLDSEGDVVMPNAFDIEKGEYPLLDTHNRCTIQALIAWGKFKYDDVTLDQLGLSGSKKVQALTYSATITPMQNQMAFGKYSTGLIRQHSLCFWYQDVQFACNETGDEWKKEKALWDTIYPKILNKEDADNLGYCWVVNSGIVREVSACVFGVSKATTTLSVSEKADKQKKGMFNYTN